MLEIIWEMSGNSNNCMRYIKCWIKWISPIPFQAQPHRTAGCRSGTSWSRSTASPPRTWHTATPSSSSRPAARQWGCWSDGQRRPTLPSLVCDPHKSCLTDLLYRFSLQTRPDSPPRPPPQSRWRGQSPRCRSPPRRLVRCRTRPSATRPTLGPCRPCRPCSSPGPSTPPPGATSDPAALQSDIP